MDTETLTAADCVKRLEELGFEADRSAPGMTLLRLAHRRVLVPDVTLERPMLRAILRSAGVSEAQFFAERTRSGTYTRTLERDVATPLRKGGE